MCVYQEFQVILQRESWDALGESSQNRGGDKKLFQAFEDKSKEFNLLR
jgi:hypothetical protein